MAASRSGTNQDQLNQSVHAFRGTPARARDDASDVRARRAARSSLPVIRQLIRDVAPCDDALTPALLNVGTPEEPVRIPCSEARQRAYAGYLLDECDGDHARREQPGFPIDGPRIPLPYKKQR
jgi:hypothetical protein